MSQTETKVNQHGFYAVPKTLQPKQKYRNPTEESIEVSQNVDPMEPIEREQEEASPDFYIDQAPYPQFKPKERGLDYGVQVEDEELFDYRLEVKPLIEILVGRSVVSALNELQEEKQLLEKNQRIEKYQRQRNAQLMLTQRMEAKHNRKQEQAQRRRLQKDLFTKNQRELARKIAARKVAKRGLLGLRKEVLEELVGEGPLRTNPVFDLRIHLQEWLYDNVMHALHADTLASKKAEKIIKEEEDNLLKKHNHHIQEENKRRKKILDQREENKRLIAEKKENKKRRKLRLAMRAEREIQYNKIKENIERHQNVVSLLKCNELSNGVGRNERSAPFSGGLFLAIIHHLKQKKIPIAQVDKIIEKILRNISKALQVTVVKNYQKLLQIQKKMNENPTEFMRNKSSQLQFLSEQIQLDWSTFDHIESDLRKELTNRVLEIFLSSQPDPSYQLNEMQKRNLELKQKINLVQDVPFEQKLKKSKQIARVRFERVQEQKETQQIDVYDGEGWKEREKKERETQSAAAYTVPEGTLVFDERNIHYMLQELQNVVGEQFAKGYAAHIVTLISKQQGKPIYDLQLYQND